MARLEPYDAAGRYLAYSDNPKRQGETYVVDLLAWAGRGECSCEDWTCRIGPHFAAGTDPPKPWCKHIAAAREEFLTAIIARMLAAKTVPHGTNQNPEHQTRPPCQTSQLPASPS